MLVAIVHHDGRFGLVADIQDPAALGAFLYGVIRTGRWWRESSRRSPSPDAPENELPKAAATRPPRGMYLGSSFLARSRPGWRAGAVVRRAGTVDRACLAESAAPAGVGQEVPEGPWQSVEQRAPRPFTADCL